MELLGYNFPSIEGEIKNYYYDTIYAHLTAGVVGRESEQNMLLIGELTVDAFKYFEEEKYNTFFSEMIIPQSINSNCIGFVEKSKEVTETLEKIGFEDIEGKYTKNGEIIGIIISSKDEISSIRAKKELGLDDSLKLLTASIVTAFVLHEGYRTKFEPSVVAGLYYHTEESLKELYG